MIPPIGLVRQKEMVLNRESFHLSESAVYQDLSLTHGKINSNGAVVVVRDTVGIYEILLLSASVRFFRACRASLKSDSAMQFQTRSESEATAIVTNLLHDL